MQVTPCLLLAVVMLAGLAMPAVRAEPPLKHRVIIETDAGGDPDDEQSLVRFLLYSNQFDVEGLVATTSTWMKAQVRPEASSMWARR